MGLTLGWEGVSPTPCSMGEAARAEAVWEAGELASICPLSGHVCAPLSKYMHTCLCVRIVYTNSNDTYRVHVSTALFPQVLFLRDGPPWAQKASSLFMAAQSVARGPSFI